MRRGSEREKFSFLFSTHKIGAIECMDLIKMSASRARNEKV
jgi:hypothetical protein